MAKHRRQHRRGREVEGNRKRLEVCRSVQAEGITHPVGYIIFYIHITFDDSHRDVQREIFREIVRDYFDKNYRLFIAWHLRKLEENEKIVEFHGVRLLRKKIRINYSDRYCINVYVWIFSRIEICGNERADALIKEAGSIESFDSLSNKRGGQILFLTML